MKFVYLLSISLALFAGCAKSSEVTELKSQLQKLQDKQIQITSELRFRQNLTEERLSKAEQELASEHLFSTGLSIVIKNISKAEAANSKDESALEGRLIGYESNLKAIFSGLDAKADEMAVLKLKEQLDGDGSGSLQARIRTLEHKVGYINETFFDQLWANQAIYGRDPVIPAPIEHIHLVERKH